MKKEVAHSVETRPATSLRAWRERLIRLNESTFLDLIRNYLGDVRTPFNKQDLLVRLENFLALPEIQERIVTFLNLNDQQLLSGIQLCRGTNEAELYRLLGNGRSFVDFHLQVLNLEDRLLVFREDDTGAVYLNPLLEATLAPQLSESFVVETIPVPQADTAQRPDSSLWFDETYLASFYGFLLEKPEMLNAQGALKKRPLEEFIARFGGIADLRSADPASDSRDDLKEVLEYTLRGLGRLGLVQAHASVLSPVHERWLEFATLPRGSALLMLWAACLELPTSPDPSAALVSPNPEYFAPARIANFARSLGSWLSKLDPRLAYADSALHLLWEIHTGIRLDTATRDRFFRSMQLLGILRPVGTFWQPDPGLHNLDSATTDSISTGIAAPVTLTPSFEASLTGSLGMQELLVLCSCGSLRSFGRIPSWELNRESCQRGYSLGIEPDTLLALLAQRSGRAVPQNISFSCNDWYRDFASVRVWDGIVLFCEGTRRTIIEHLEDLKPWILGSPAPGVVVLDRSGRSEWLPMLANAGIPASTLSALGAAESAGAESGSNSVPGFLPPFASLDLEGLKIVWAATLPSSAESTETDTHTIKQSAQKLREDFFSRLAASDFSPEIREELEKHIRNSLILREEQLSTTTVRPDRSEARGLDYGAKIRVMEQAIKNRRDFLELTQNNGAGNSYTLLVWPQKLRQTGSELILSAQTVPEGKELSIVTGKVSLVRRIRATLFS